MLKLTDIHIYPIKSLGGVSLLECKAYEKGLNHDRRYMIVDENGLFITQRVKPQMALFKTIIDNSQLIVTAPDQSRISISLTNYSKETINVKIWNDECIAHTISDAHDRWFSDKLDTECRLVYMGDHIRDTNSRYGKGSGAVSYADAYPYLIVGEASLNTLNDKLEVKIPIDRFRPNLTFSGGEGFDEDHWGDFSIGEARFYGVKPCARCTVTTIDQSTAQVAKNKEPLVTLSKFRKQGHKILFGLNAVVSEAGIVRVGDQIRVISKK